MKKLGKITNIATLVALGLAILVGFLLPEFAKDIKFFGDWYVKTLKILISPIIFLSMSLFVLKRDGTKKFLLGKTVLLFIGMFVVTFLMSSLIVGLTHPGTNFVGEAEEYVGGFSDLSFKGIFEKLVPQSFEKFFYGDYIFFVIVCSLIIAFILSLTPAKKAYTKGLEFCKKYVDVALKIVIFLTPLAVLSLVSNLIVSNKAETFMMGLVYILFAYGLSVLTILIVMILPVWLIAKVNPITYIKKVSKVWLMTISTCSSAATLPYTIKVCNEEFGVDEKITDVVVPLGCTIHMCGGAISFSLLGLFVAQLNGITVTIPMYLLMLALSTLINMAAPGIPGGGKVIGATYLSILGFPFESFFGLYLAIYSFLDMAYTTLNVTGDVSANILLDHFEKRKEIKQEDKKVAE